MLAWLFVGKVSGRMLVTVSIKYCPRIGEKYDMKQSKANITVEDVVDGEGQCP
jgi:hypothetical protein